MPHNGLFFSQIHSLDLHACQLFTNKHWIRDFQTRCPKESWLAAHNFHTEIQNLSRWCKFVLWCHQQNIDSQHASVNRGCDSFLFPFMELKLSPSSVKGCCNDDVSHSNPAEPHAFQSRSRGCSSNADLSHSSHNLSCSIFRRNHATHSRTLNRHSRWDLSDSHQDLSHSSSGRSYVNCSTSHGHRSSHDRRCSSPTQIHSYLLIDPFQPWFGLLKQNDTILDAPGQSPALPAIPRPPSQRTGSSTNDTVNCTPAPPPGLSHIPRVQNGTAPGAYPLTISKMSAHPMAKRSVGYASCVMMLQSWRHTSHPSPPHRWQPGQPLDIVDTRNLQPFMKLFSRSNTGPLYGPAKWGSILRAVPEIILGGCIFFQTPPPPGHARSRSPLTPRTRKCFN